MRDIPILEEFGYDYYKLYTHINKYLFDNSLSTEKQKGLFKKRKIDLSEIKGYDEIAAKYRIIKDKYESYNRWNFASFLIDFVYFSKIMEKCYMYQNDDSNKVYTLYDGMDEKYTVKIDCEDFIIEYKIQKSEINMPQKRDSLNALLGIEEVRDKVIFCDIVIKRMYGEHMTDKFSIVSDSPVPIEDLSDDVLLTTIYNITKDIIFESFNDILNNVTRLNPGQKLDIKEVMENDKLDVWRSRPRKG